MDDGLALLYLLGHRDAVRIEGITTTYGNSDVDTVYDNTKSILSELELDIPVFKGCPDRHSIYSEAVEHMVRSALSSGDDLYILATGSLTNVYRAYGAEQQFFEGIKGIVLMGGITSPLIINGRNMEELNFSCDPAAAYCVLSKGKNVSVITGNNCLPAYFTHADYHSRLCREGSRLGRYVYEKTRCWFDYMKDAYDSTGFYGWDVVAAAYLAEKELFADCPFSSAATVQSLQQGFLPQGNTDGGFMINLPRIKEAGVLIEDVYRAWQRIQ